MSAEGPAAGYIRIEGNRLFLLARAVAGARLEAGWVLRHLLTFKSRMLTCLVLLGLACLLVFVLAVVVGCVMKLRPSSHTLISNDPVFTWRSRFDKMPRLLSYLAFAIYAASLAACPRFSYGVNRTPRLNY